MTLKFDGWPWKTIGHLFYTTSSFVHHFKSIGDFKLELQSGNARFGSKSTIFFVPCDLEIWRMTLKNNRAPLLCCFKLCASFHTHWWIQIWVTVRKRSIRVKIDDFFSRVTLKFYGWPSKAIGHLFYATSSFVYRFVPIGEFKLELQSENAQFVWNSTIFSRATLKFIGWPWKTIGHLVLATSSFVQHFVPIGEFKLVLQSGNAQSRSNSTIFSAVRSWNLTDDLAKQ